jgi:hypothetical protein
LGLPPINVPQESHEALPACDDVTLKMKKLDMAALQAVAAE